MAMNKSAGRKKALFRLPINKVAQSHGVLDAIENSRAVIVVIDNSNGLQLEDTKTKRIIYQLRSVTVRNEIIVLSSIICPSRENA